MNRIIVMDGRIDARRRWPGGRNPWWVVGVLGLAGSTAVFGQRAVRIERRPDARRQAPTIFEAPRPDAQGLMLGPSAPVSNLFDRAAEGIARRDWKFAIDCLQRIVDDPENSMVLQADLGGRGAVFESARRRAIAQLAALPPDAQDVYRLVHNGKARRLYELGVRQQDARALYAVAERYLLTDHGPQAADQLASWALDSGRPAETIRLLTELTTLHPHHDLPPEHVFGKLAAAYALLGRPDDAKQTIADWPGPDREDSAARVSEQLAELTSLPRIGAPTVRDWPMAGGAPARASLMSIVEPSLVEPLPWEAALPGSAADSWRRVLGGGTIGSLTLPVGQPVSRDGRVFTRTPNGVAAFDAEDLYVLWEANVLPAEDTSGRTILRQRPRAPGLTDDGVVFDDYVAGEISLAGDLVLAVSREGSGEYTLRRRDSTQRGWLAWAPLPVGRRPIEGTRLIAMDQATGEVRWTRGRTGNADDPLGNAWFHAVPIDVDGKLWVAYVREGDLALAVLDPKDGALIRSVPLTSVGRGSSWGPRETVMLAAGDGMVYVPVSDELLFAVSSVDYAVRWANQFSASEDSAALNGSNAASTGFLPTPPIAMDGLLIHAPANKDEVIVFDVVSGAVRWSTVAPASAYLIAAERGRLYVGGRSITCRSLDTGAAIWQRPLSAAPSGRAVFSGGLIHVPTVDALISLSAETGDEVRSEPLPASQEPLGNLLCLNHAVYTLHSASIRKFVDLERSYHQTTSTLNSGRADPATIVRLAWLEIWRGEPERAYDVLRTLPESFGQNDKQRAAPAAQARVEALLAMAGQTGGSRNGEEVLGLLQEALTAATTLRDRLRCSLAVADQLVSMGRAVEAYRGLWALGMEDDADALVAQEQYVYQRTRARIATRLAAIASRLTAEEIAAIESTAVDGAAKPAASDDLRTIAEFRARLRAVADLSVVGVIGQRALLHLGMDYATEQRWAQAEQLLRESVSRGADPTLSAAGLARLAEMYRDMIGSGFGGDAAMAETLGTLTSKFGAQKAGPVLALIGVAATTGDVTIGEWAADLRSRQGLEDPRVPHDRTSSAAPLLSGDLAWKLEAEGNADVPRLIRFGEDRPNAVAAEVLLIDPDDVVSSYEAKTGVVLWRAALRLPGVFHEFSATRFRPEEDVARFAAADGLTGVFAGRAGLFAVELSTGRRLWVMPVDRNTADEEARMHDLRISAADGFVAMTPRTSRLTVARASDGKIVWERDLMGENVAALQIVNNRIITVDNRLERLHLFDRDNGRLLRRVHFAQPDPSGHLVQLAMTGNILAGPVTGTNSEGVVGIDLATGEERWRVVLDKPLVELSEPKTGYIGIGLLGGDFRIVEAETGEPAVQRRVAGAQGVIRGAMIDGTIVVQHFNDRSGVRASSLSALDVATDHELWHRDDVSPLWLSEAELRATRGRLPVILLDEGTERDRQNRRIARSVRIALMDLRTGRQLGRDIPLSTTNQLGQYNGDYAFLPAAGVLVISAQQTIHALRLERPEGDNVDDL